MAGRPRDYTHIHEIHMEPAELHEATNTVPAYSADLDNALERVARSDCSRLKGTEFDIAMRRMERDGDTRYPLAADDRKVGISATTQM